MHEGDVIGSFVEAMASHGIPVRAADIVADGQIHRIHVEGDKKGSKNAWYVLHYDQHPAGAFGCNKRLGMDTRIKWTADKAVKLTTEERIELRKKMRAQREAKALEEAVRWDAASKNAQALIEAASPAGDHPYLARKGVESFGLMVGPWSVTNRETGDVIKVTDSALYIPMRDLAKRVWSLQAIFPSDKNPLRRDKSFLQDGKKQGLFFTIGKPKKVAGKKVILLCEGYATGASIHMATGHAVVVAFDAGNMLHVGRSFREHFPDAELIYCADNDRWTTQPVDNPGLYWADRAAKETKGHVALPDFPEDALASRPTDFNDLHQITGLDEVATFIGPVLVEIEARERTIKAVPEPTQAKAEAAPIEPVPPVRQPPAPADDGPPPPRRDNGGYFLMLGYDREKYYFYQHEKKQVLDYTKSDFTETGLIALAPLNYWEMEFPAQNGGMDKKMAVDALMRGCNKEGIYDPSRRRGWALGSTTTGTCSTTADTCPSMESPLI